MSVKMTSYHAVVCDDCVPTFSDVEQGRMVNVTAADFRDVWGYDSACCEECKTVVYDGLAAGVR